MIVRTSYSPISKLVNLLRSGNMMIKVVNKATLFTVKSAHVTEQAVTDRGFFHFGNAT